MPTRGRIILLLLVFALLSALVMVVLARRAVRAEEQFQDATQPYPIP